MPYIVLRTKISRKIAVVRASCCQTFPDTMLKLDIYTISFEYTHFDTIHILIFASPYTCNIKLCVVLLAVVIFGPLHCVF